MAILNCEVKIAPVEGLEPEIMTVGRRLNLKCNSDSQISAAQNYELQSDNNPAITYKVFKINKTNDSNFEIEMTFYKAGQFQLTDFKVFDGTESHSLVGPQITIQSVLKPSQDGKPQKPYDPIFPIGMSIPSIYYLYILAGIIIVLSFFALKIRRIRHYKKLKDKLKNFETPVDPDVQFYRSIRAVEKLGFPIENLDNAFRLYNLRAYQLPIFDLPNEKLNKYFKHNFPQYKNARIQMFRILADIEELRKTATSEKDDALRKKELINKMYKYVETHKGVLRE